MSSMSMSPNHVPHDPRTHASRPAWDASLTQSLAPAYRGSPSTLVNICEPDNNDTKTNPASRNAPPGGGDCVGAAPDVNRASNGRAFSSAGADKNQELLVTSSALPGGATGNNPARLAAAPTSDGPGGCLSTPLVGSARAPAAGAGGPTTLADAPAAGEAPPHHPDVQRAGVDSGPVTATTATTRTACDARQTAPVEGNAAMATQVSRLLETPGCTPNRAVMTCVAYTHPDVQRAGVDSGGDADPPRPAPTPISDGSGDRLSTPSDASARAPAAESGGSATLADAPAAGEAPPPHPDVQHVEDFRLRKLRLMSPPTVNAPPSGPGDRLSTTLDGSARAPAAGSGDSAAPADAPATGEAPPLHPDVQHADGLSLVSEDGDDEIVGHSGHTPSQFSSLSGFDRLGGVLGASDRLSTPFGGPAHHVSSCAFTQAPSGVASPSLPDGFPALRCHEGSSDIYPRREAESRQRSVRGCSNGPVQRCLHQSGSPSSRTLEADSPCSAEQPNAASTCSALTLPAGVSACVRVREDVVDASERAGCVARIAVLRLQRWWRGRMDVCRASPAGCVARIAVLRLQRWWRGRMDVCRASPVDVVSPAGDGTAGDGTPREACPSACPTATPSMFLDLHSGLTHVRWHAPAGWTPDQWGHRLSAAATKVQAAFRRHLRGDDVDVLLLPCGLASRPPATTLSAEAAPESCDEIQASADLAYSGAPVSLLTTQAASGDGGTLVARPTEIPAQRRRGLAGQGGALLDVNGKRVGVRQLNALRKIVFMFRGFLYADVPPRVRHSLWLGSNPTGRKVREFESILAKYVRRDADGRIIRAGLGVPRHLWARKYPRSICGCTSAYFVPGAMATPADFADHRERALKCILSYRAMGTELLQISISVPLRVVHGCSGACGVGADLHLDGVESLVTDIAFQADAARWYGKANFAQMDALDVDAVIDQLRKPGTVLYMVAPECDAFSDLGSGALGVGSSSSPQLFGPCVAVAKIARKSTGVVYLAETVGSAKPFTDPALTVVHRAIHLGVQSDDPHCVESSLGHLTRTDAALTDQGRWLASHSCVGGYAIMGKLDNFGMAAKPCCPVGLAQKLSVHGTQPAPGVTMADICGKLGIDPRHPSSYKVLVDMVSPVSGRLWFHQTTAKIAHHSFGVPSLSYDSILADPPLLLIHDLARAHLQLRPRVPRAYQLIPLLPHVSHAILVIQPLQQSSFGYGRGSLVSTSATGQAKRRQLPLAEVRPGDYMVEAAFASFESVHPRRCHQAASSAWRD